LLDELVERLLMRLLTPATAGASRKDEYAVVVTFASLLLINLVDKITGRTSHPSGAAADRRRLTALRSGRRDADWPEGDRRGHRVIALMIALALFIKRSVWGLQIRRGAESPRRLARRHRRRRGPRAWIFIVSGMLAALSGASLAPLVNPSPDIGAFPAVKSYVIVVLGGMGLIWGAMIAWR
jgi:branched-chain amino acid transport system permease protein